MGGRDNLRLNQLLQDQVAFEFVDWSLAVAVQQLEACGLTVTEQLEAFPETRVADIGAVVYYLRAIPWQIEGFTVDGYREKLLALHEMIERAGGLWLASHRFYVEAVKP